MHCQVWDFQNSPLVEENLVQMAFMGLVGTEGLYVPAHLPYEATVYALLAEGGSPGSLMERFPVDGSVFDIERLTKYFPDGEPFGCGSWSQQWTISTCNASRW